MLVKQQDENRAQKHTVLKAIHTLVEIFYNLRNAGSVEPAKMNVAVSIKEENVELVLLYNHGIRRISRPYFRKTDYYA